MSTAWLPFCDNTSCICMQPNLSGLCDEHKEHPLNPRCLECGWPARVHGPCTLLPGPLLRHMLAAAGLSQAEAARRVGYSAKHMNQIVQGHKPIMPDFAANLSLTLGLNGHFLLRAQADYDYALRVHLLATDETTADAH